MDKWGGGADWGLTEGVGQRIGTSFHAMKLSFVSSKQLW